MAAAARLQPERGPPAASNETGRQPKLERRAEAVLIPGAGPAQRQPRRAERENPAEGETKKAPQNLPQEKFQRRRRQRREPRRRRSPLSRAAGNSPRRAGAAFALVRHFRRTSAEINISAYRQRRAYLVNQRCRRGLTVRDGDRSTTPPPPPPQLDHPLEQHERRGGTGSSAGHTGTGDTSRDQVPHDLHGCLSAPGRTGHPARRRGGVYEPAESGLGLQTRLRAVREQNPVCLPPAVVPSG